MKFYLLLGIAGKNEFSLSYESCMPLVLWEVQEWHFSLPLDFIDISADNLSHDWFWSWFTCKFVEDLDLVVDADACTLSELLNMTCHVSSMTLVDQFCVLHLVEHDWRIHACMTAPFFALFVFRVESFVDL